jgi:hypothetical protein
MVICHCGILNFVWLQKELMILCFPHWQFAVNIFLIMMQRYRDSLKVKFWHTLLAAIIISPFSNFGIALAILSSTRLTLCTVLYLLF